MWHKKDKSTIIFEKLNEYLMIYMTHFVKHNLNYDYDLLLISYVYLIYLFICK